MLAQLVVSLLAILPAGENGGSGPAPVSVAQAPAPVPPAPAGAPKSAEPAPAPPAPLYQAPRTGQPRGRMAGITRDAAELQLRPLALAPEHVAQTLSARPRLYWSLDGSHTGPVRFTLATRDAVEPACELELAAPSGPGSFAVDLERCPGALEPGVEYEWFVALIADPAQRSRDRIAQGWIRRSAPPPDLDVGSADASSLARSGFWYDALQRAADARDRDTWRALLAELSITSVELPGARE